MSNLDLQKKLAAPFSEDEIEWRVQTAGVSRNGSPYVMVIPYVTNRAIQNRLDDVFGVFGWRNEYQPSGDGKGFLCGITVDIDGKEITKWDGAEYTNVEALKGALSDSMKRTGVQFGIGRYLYKLDVAFAVCCVVENRRDAVNLHTIKKQGQPNILVSWERPSLPSWALPTTDYSEFVKAIESAPDMEALKVAFTNAYNASRVNQDSSQENAFIKLKDARKAFIQSTIDKIRKEKFDAIVKWIDQETKILSQLPTNETIKAYSEKTRDQLKGKLSADVNAKAVFEYFDSIVNKHIK
jgi:hypothetical protein